MLSAGYIFSTVSELLDKYVKNEIPEDKLDLDFIIELFERGKYIKSSSYITLAESPDGEKLQNTRGYELYHSLMEIICDTISERFIIIYEEMESASDEILQILNLR